MVALTIHTSRLSRLVARVTGGVILLTLGWQAGVLAVQLLAPEQSVVFSNSRVQTWLQAGQKPQPVPEHLAHDTLFSAQPSRPEPVVVPKTPLKMVLSAVFVAPEAKDSGAIIASLNKTAAYYKVGDEVAPGIRLLRVGDDHVVLDRNGQQESLYFKDQDRRGGLSAERTPAASAAADRPSVPPRPSVGPIPQGAAKAVQSLPETELGSDIRRLNAAAFMKKYQQKMQQDPAGLLSEAGVSAAPGGGYRIGDSPYAGLLTSAGLEVGDVVLSVNGNRLGDPGADAQLLGTLSQQNEVEVLIQRGSRQFAVTFPVTR